MKIKSTGPTLTLPKREGIADRVRFRSDDITPSLWGRVGVGLLCLILCGCITKYNPKGIDEVADILVVEGIITDNETTITLSRSMILTDEADAYHVNNAKVYVECDDGTQWRANGDYGDNGRYTIITGQLVMARRYRLKIEVEEPDYGSDDCYPNSLNGITCPTKTYEYCSVFSYPIQTPEIDSIFWMKKDRGQPVTIYVATHSTNNDISHYRWSYKEDWEIKSDFFLEDYPYHCWNMAESNELLLGSTQKTAFGRLTEKLTEISPSDRKVSVLYRIDVRQNAISKQAYDYFANIKKNAQQTGGLFAPIPSELRGNITCTTDPGKPVIGYVDVSTTTKERIYISYMEVYELSFTDCRLLSRSDLCEMLGVRPESCTFFEVPDRYVRVDPFYYTNVECVDCTSHGTTQKPDDWPNHY